MKKLLTLCILFTICSIAPLSQGLRAEVEPPNYNFSLDALAFFMPGKDLASIEAKYGKGEIMQDNGETKLYRFYVAQIRYKFPVFVNVKDAKTLDFHARLPTYFSHDLFHQALINRYGKQDQYLKSENNALYLWKNKNSMNHTYAGTCTITCFPIFYSVSPEPLPSGHIPILKSLTLPDSPQAPGL